jgi:hypothetical protein
MGKCDGRTIWGKSLLGKGVLEDGIRWNQKLLFVRFDKLNIWCCLKYK